jgi:hypothetical protein
MNGRIYSVIFDNVAVTTAVDYFELNPAADKPLRILAVDVGQTNRTGDANEDMLRWSIVRMTGATLTSGSGGTTPTPVAVNPGDPAASFTAKANNTTAASTTGTTSTVHASTFNTRVGLLWVPTPEMWPVGIDSAATGVILVRLLEAPGASTTFSGTVYVEEIG